MHNVPDPSTLSEDQPKRVAAILKRIREGLDCANRLIAPEPCHLFTPKIQDTMRP
jgi:hypothetical protein